MTPGNAPQPQDSEPEGPLRPGNGDLSANSNLTPPTDKSGRDPAESAGDESPGRLAEGPDPTIQNGPLPHPDSVDLGSLTSGPHNPADVRRKAIQELSDIDLVERVANLETTLANLDKELVTVGDYHPQGAVRDNIAWKVEKDGVQADYYICTAVLLERLPTILENALTNNLKAVQAILKPFARTLHETAILRKDDSNPAHVHAFFARQVDAHGRDRQLFLAGALVREIAVSGTGFTMATKLAAEHKLLEEFASRWGIAEGGMGR